jgi:GNAT superfamily N-acetyltransferase
MTITVRELTGDEIVEVFHRLPGYALRASPPLYDRDELAESVRQREGATYFGLFEDGAPVACAGSSPMTQNVRGRLFSTGGVFDVATMPAGRRKGYARRTIAALLAAVRSAGATLSCLYPFRESFYSCTTVSKRNPVDCPLRARHHCKSGLRFLANGFSRCDILRIP